MEEIKLVQLNNEKRVEILKKLGYGVNSEGYVIKDSTKKEVICKYSGEKVHINTAAILPGSLLVINANPLTMAEYFVEIDSQNGKDL